MIKKNSDSLTEIDSRYKVVLGVFWGFFNTKIEMW